MLGSCKESKPKYRNFFIDSQKCKVPGQALSLKPGLKILKSELFLY